MQGDAAVIEALNAILTSELTAINQYFIHSRMNENWGYDKIAEQKKQESIGEMKHADRVIERVLYLEGVPNMQRLNPVRVGENVPEQHKLDLELEVEAVKRLNDAIALCRDNDRCGVDQRAHREHRYGLERGVQNQEPPEAVGASPVAVFEYQKTHEDPGEEQAGGHDRCESQWVSHVFLHPAAIYILSAAP